MSHEEFWSWLYKIATVPPPYGLGWSPDTALNCDMSLILLTLEGRKELQAMAAEPQAGEMTPEMFDAAFHARG
jgi:hypothetical protein